VRGRRDAAPAPGSVAVVDALRTLGAQDRQVLLDTYLRRRGVADAARVTGTSPALVSARLHGGLRALGAALGAPPSTVPGAHPDVAAFALGLVDEFAASAFAEHLFSCAGCTAELAALRPVVARLATVARYAVPLDDASRQPTAIAPAAAVTPATGLTRPVVSEPARDAARRERRPHRSRSSRLLLPLAATVGLLAAGGALTVEELRLTPAPEINRDAAGAPVRQVAVRDPRTLARGEMVLTATPSGTDVSLSLSDVGGPRTCRLLAVGPTGELTVLSTWRVPRSGFGTSAQPDPMRLSVSTGLRGDDLARLVVQSVDTSGKATTLVAATL
jgi:hypothetical protein